MPFSWMFGIFCALVMISLQFVPKNQTPKCVDTVKVRSIEAVRTNKSWFVGLDNTLYETNKLEYAVGDEICSNTITKVKK